MKIEDQNLIILCAVLQYEHGWDDHITTDRKNRYGLPVLYAQFVLPVHTVLLFVFHA